MYLLITMMSLLFSAAVKKTTLFRKNIFTGQATVYLQGTSGFPVFYFRIYGFNYAASLKYRDFNCGHTGILLLNL